MAQSKCENQGCENVGGKQHLVGEKWVCDACFTAPANRDTAKSTFPFTTKHLTGEPIKVQSIRHLRQLENRHGAHSDAYC